MHMNYNPVSKSKTIRNCSKFFSIWLIVPQLTMIIQTMQPQQGRREVAKCVSFSFSYSDFQCLSHKFWLRTRALCKQRIDTLTQAHHSNAEIVFLGSSSWEYSLWGKNCERLAGRIHPSKYIWPLHYIHDFS